MDHSTHSITMSSVSAPFVLTDSDQQHLALSDDEFRLHDWDNLTSIIGN